MAWHYLAICHPHPYFRHLDGLFIWKHPPMALDKIRFRRWFICLPVYPSKNICRSNEGHFCANFPTITPLERSSHYFPDCYRNDGGSKTKYEPHLGAAWACSFCTAVNERHPHLQAVAQVSIAAHFNKNFCMSFL